MPLERRACPFCNISFDVPLEEYDTIKDGTYLLSELPDPDNEEETDCLYCPCCEETVAERPHVDPDPKVGRAGLAPWQWKTKEEE